ncbi:MAG: hypothetical protein ACRD0L_15165 [Acidimicrobiales bacterium]
MSAAGPRIGVLADLDGTDLTPWLALRVLRAEMRRRTPGCEVVALSPAAAATPLDGGEPVEPAGPWTAERRAELASDLDGVAVILVPEGGRPGARWPPPEGLGVEHDGACPGARLEPGSLAALAAGAFSSGGLDRRLGWLRLMGWHPGTGRTLVVDTEGASPLGVAAALDVLGPITHRHPDVSVLVLGVGPGAELPAWVMPLIEPLSAEDVVAVHRAALMVLGAAPASEGLARAYGRRFGALPDSGSTAGDLGAAVEAVLAGPSRENQGQDAGTGSAGEPGHAAHGIEDQLAAWAVRVRGQAGRRSAQVEPAVTTEAGAAGLLAAAHQAQRRHSARVGLLVAELLTAHLCRQREIEARLAELRTEASEGYARHEAELGALRAEIVALRTHVEALTGDRDGLRTALAASGDGRDRLERELEATRATRLFRWTAGPRRVYGAILRRRR